MHLPAGSPMIGILRVPPEFVGATPRGSNPRTSTPCALRTPTPGHRDDMIGANRNVVL
jgi:hypothetical protein